ncbi:MAG: PEP/pyruvate-binding domain-containing protein [Chloroflexota bacterium]
MVEEPILVVPLSALDKTSLPVAGGKAANLGELMRAGFNVPAGFCLTTEAYRLAIAEAALAPRLAALVGALDAEDAASLVATGAAARQLFYDAPLPAVVREAALASLAELGDAPLAVRSSATAEDLPEASFAGQQETYLNVVGPDALLEAVRRCWASLWTDRALAYRSRNGIDHLSVALAVVVQRLVPAEVAGVLFTANPVTGKRGEVAIDASLGLGEAVVSGQVSPDNYLVAKGDWRLLEKRLGGKAVQVLPRQGGGTTTTAVAEHDAGRQALTDEQIVGLARLGAQVEEHYGWPQDIEWALAGGVFYLLQSRPITSLFPIPPAHADGRLRVYLSVNSLQGMLEPLTPLGNSLFTTAVREVALGGDANRQYLHVLAQRLYVDATPLLHTGFGHDVFAPTVLAQIDPVSGQIVTALLADPRLAAGARSARGDFMHAARRLRRYALPGLRLALGAALRPSSVRDHLARQVVPLLARFSAEAAREQSPLARLEAIERFWHAEVPNLFPRLVPVVAAGVAVLARAQVLVDHWGLSGEQMFLVRQGLPHNPTTNMDLELWALSRRVQADAPSRAALGQEEPSRLAALFRQGELPAALQEGLRHFLGRYGHRCIREIDVGLPRWGEDPSYLFSVLRGYSSLEGSGAAPDKHFAAQAAAAERAVDELQAQARRLPGGRLKAALLGFLLRRYRQLGGFREAPKFYMMHVFRTLRRHYLAIGADLAQQGRLERAEDVVYLQHDELRPALAGELDLPQLVAQRRHEYERELRRLRAPRVVTSEGVAYYGEPRSPRPGVLAGVGVSPGAASGKVRVVRDPLVARLEAGEVLVAPSTDPAWTPLFLTAGALVMEAGGMMSHGAIVAREYGIPAVVGVADATSRLATGQTVEVDGNQGLVQIVE